MTDDEDDGDLYGAGAPAHVGRMRPSQQLTERWRAAVAKRNEAGRSRFGFRSPLEGAARLEELRQLPALPWPAQWPNLARRARTYPGDILGIVGPIGGGKTSFALQMGLAATAAGLPVLWTPLELGEPQVTTRLVANMHGIHAAVVRDSWPLARIESTISAVTDLWRYVDKVRHLDPKEQVARQLAACDLAVEIAWEVFRRPPVLIIDHIHHLVGGQPDETSALRAAAVSIEEMTERRSCYTILLGQSSVSGQQALTGRIDKDTAADFIGSDSGGKAVSSSSANCLAVAVFKEDDATHLDAHANVSKSRHVGGEGRVGMRFQKAGGVWSELDYLPATPTQVREAAEAAKKDKHRAAPPPTTAEARAELNVMREQNEAQRRMGYILEAIERHGALGMDMTEVRKVRGAGRGAAVMQAIQELERRGAIERASGGRWRKST